jgi:hypothetical protein
MTDITTKYVPVAYGTAETGTERTKWPEKPPLLWGNILTAAADQHIANLAISAKFSLETLRRPADAQLSPVESIPQSICLQVEDLRQYVELGRSLIPRFFKSSRIVVEMGEDPETNQAHVILRVQVKGSVVSSVRAYQKFTLEWNKAVPPVFRECIRFSLSYV